MPKAILLADDSLTIQKVVELTLSDTGYQLSAVSNGIEALAALAKARPDLVIADVVMPGKNGYEVCEAIKSNPATANIPVILLSGTFEPFDRERAEKARANAIVTKPFDSKNLLSQVEALLASAPPETAPAEAESFLTQAVPSPAAPATTLSADTGQFFPDEMERPEPVTGDIEAAISAYERRESETLETGEFSAELEVLERTPEEPVHAEPPKSTVPFPMAPRPEPPPVQPLDFTLEDTSPFEKAASPEPPILPVNEMAVFEEPDNVFEFPANAPPPAAPVAPAVAAPAPPSAPPPEVSPPAVPSPAEETASARPVSPDLERLAQSASISDLASMVSRVAPGATLSEEDLERLSRKVVERLSERILREIAWEVIPDLAEIEVRRRIREIEAEAARESD